MSSQYDMDIQLASAIISRIREEIANSPGHNMAELGYMRERGNKLFLIPDSTPNSGLGPDIYLVDRTLAFVPDYPMTRTLMSQPADGAKGEEHSTRWGWHKHSWRTGKALAIDQTIDHTYGSATEHVPAVAGSTDALDLTADIEDTFVSTIPGVPPNDAPTITASVTTSGGTGTATINQTTRSLDHEHRMSIPVDEGDKDKALQWRVYDTTGIDNYNEHTHDIQLPWRFEPLKNGDRVLINWAVGGLPVIVAVVHRGNHEYSQTLYDGTVLS